MGVQVEVAVSYRASNERTVVSVALPTYNRRASFERAARSVVQQDYQPIELVISDNASPDGTAEVCAELTSEHAIVRVVRQSENIGPTRNFREAAALTTGEYVMWLGDDDWLDPSYIRSCVDRLEADPSVALVAGLARYHDGAQQWPEAAPIQVLDPDPCRRVLDYFRQVGSNGAFYGVVSREVFERLPPLPNLMGGDMIHLASIAFAGKVVTHEDAYVHRTVGGATSSLAAVAIHAGLGWFQRNAPQLAIAWFVLRDIGWQSPVYTSLGRAGRIRLGVHASAIICRRFLPGAIVKFARIQVARAARRRPSVSSGAPA